PARVAPVATSAWSAERKDELARPAGCGHRLARGRARCRGGVRHLRTGYAVPAGWGIPRGVLGAAARGAPPLGRLPGERPRDRTRPDRGTRGGRARERGSAAALAREAAGRRHLLLAGHRAQRLVLLGSAAVPGVASWHSPGRG